MADSPTPENNPMLRQMVGLRRDLQEIMERQARSIDQVNRLALRVDETLTAFRDELAYVRRDSAGARTDIVQMEMRVLTAIGEVKLLTARMDETEGDIREALERIGGA